MTPPRAISSGGYRLPKEFLARVQTPFLAVHLDIVRRNVQVMLRHLKGETGRWRPHLKTSKSPAVYRELVAAGVRSFKCATTGEAACMLGVLDAMGVGGADLLVAYPLLGQGLVRLGALADLHPATGLSVLVENPEQVDAVPAAIGVWIDVDCGMHRTGVPLAARDRMKAIAVSADDRLRGMHAYEGHVTEGTLDARHAEAWPIYRGLIEAVGALSDAGIRVPELVTSGTPSSVPALEYPAWSDLASRGTKHRVSAGTVVLHDARSMRQCPELDLRPAAIVHAHVVSHPAKGIWTCNAGSKAIAVDAGDPCAVVMDRPELRALTPSEEHLPLHCANGAGGVEPVRGEELLLVPMHVCPTVNLADRIVLVDDGSVVGVESVAARGHEL